MTYWTGDAIEVGETEQLLIDDHVVEDAWGVERRVCSPQMHPVNPAIATDRPWEYGSIGGVTVLRDEDAGLYRMFYSAYHSEAAQRQTLPQHRETWTREKDGCAQNVCCAVSRDGFHWEKPDLGLHSWRSHKHTNIVFTGETRAGGRPTENPTAEDPSQRYVMIYNDRDAVGAPMRRRMVFSPDGLHWSRHEGYPELEGPRDGGDGLCWDPASAQWFRYLRPPMLAVDKSVPSEAVALNIKRRMCVMTSPDLKQWTFPRNCLLPDELDPTPNTMDSFNVFKYGSHFICFFTEMNEPDEGRCLVRIASSADGYDWTRIPTRPVFFRKPGDEPGYLQAPAPPIEIGDWWVLYVGGCPRGQCAQRNGLAYALTLVQPKGRLVARWAGRESGFLLTRELLIGGRCLEINCESIVSEFYDDTDMIRVGIAKRRHGPNAQTADGYYDGFALGDCDPVILEDVTSRRVSWKGKTDLSALVGKPAYLRFQVRDMGLYSFRFTSA